MDDEIMYTQDQSFMQLITSYTLVSKVDYSSFASD